jgi:hypothetical protein
VSRRAGAALWLGLLGLAAAPPSCRSEPATAPGGTAALQAAASPPVAAPPAASPAPAAAPASGPGEMEAPAAKRVGPPDVPPVTIGALRFSVVHWGRERGLGQNGGYIAASDGASGRELWTLKVYTVTYDPKMEEDVQDIFIEAMTAGPGARELTVTDERGGQYRVDTSTRRVNVVKPRP